MPRDSRAQHVQKDRRVLAAVERERDAVDAAGWAAGSASGDDKTDRWDMAGLRGVRPHPYRSMVRSAAATDFANFSRRYSSFTWFCIVCTTSIIPI